MTDTPLDSVAGTIVAVAQQKGVDPRLALADAYDESTLNPDAVGDNGTSFGLYQLHEGGELGSLSPTQAFDPATNANVALGVMAQVAAQHPGADPGTIAALAERPANPGAYAAAVDAIYNNPSFYPQITATGSTGATPAAGSSTSTSTTSAAGSPATLTSLWSTVTDPVGTIKTAGGYLALIGAGAGMVMLGVWKLANPNTSVRSIVANTGAAAVKTAGVAAA